MQVRFGTMSPNGTLACVFEGILPRRAGKGREIRLTDNLECLLARVVHAEHFLPSLGFFRRLLHHLRLVSARIQSRKELPIDEILGVVDGEVHNGLRDQIAESLRDDLHVGIDQIPDRLHLQRSSFLVYGTDGRVGRDLGRPASSSSDFVTRRRNFSALSTPIADIDALLPVVRSLRRQFCYR